MSEAFLKIVNMSISASWLVLAVLALRLVLKKAPKWVNVLLWGIVAVRLICPVSIESILSLIPSAETVSPDIMMDWTPEVSTGIPAVDTVVNPVITETFAPEPIASANPLQILIPVSANLWLLGILVMLGYTAVSYFLLRRKVATAVRLRDNIYQSENVASPFVLGIVRPKIYLPFRIDGGNLSHVIAHEEAHIRRKDHWWKPFGFVLLALHWFNPLMWIGYILLSRDIELACDEKVIKEMNNETKADYMEALVACSVNRRSIAACPLAFGEVGVKERVKTMMNYKKPAFWIVIAAVALCIVVAVCFLTDPKDYGPKVGNPKMLEFPGVEWGMTVEEVKQALDLTEEQIMLDEIYEPGEDNGDIFDLWYLYVSDLTAYGEDVVSAGFEFIRYPGNDFGLIRVRAYFAEDTDMVKLEEKLTELYGQGVGSTYRFYTFYGPNEKYYINAEPNGELKLFAKRSDKDSVYSDALNDPEYREQLWVATGADVLPDDVENWYIERSVKNGYTEEAMRECLDQEPLVRMFIANRTYQAADREANGIEDEYQPYITHNFMEYNANNLVCYSQLRAYEDYLSALEEDNRAGMLELPGVKWGASVEELKQALNLIEEQIVADEVIGDHDRRLTVSGLEFFGSQVDRAIFAFAGDGDGVQELYTLRLIYADDTDMNKIRDNMKEIYGTGYEFGFTDYAIHDGEAQSFINYNYSNKVEYGTAMSDDIVYKLRDNPMIHRWASTAKGTEINSQEVVDAFVALYTDPAFLNHASREEVLEWIDKHPWVTVTCSNGSTVSKEPLCSVHFTAEFIAVKRQAMAWAANNQTGGDGVADAPVTGSKSLLEFPGLKWGMTVEEVKSALSITQQQILRDEQYEYPPDGGNADERWDLYVKDLQIFGHKVNMAGFEFVRISDDDPNNAAVAGNTGGAFALWHIQVFLDEETDMEKLEQELTMAYGQGVGGVYNYIDWSTGRPYESSTPANSILSNYAKRAAKDSVFYGVMDDPAYREQMWVCSDASVISDTTRTRITQIVGENGYSEEEIHGWLNQFPWITLRFTNTTHWGILKEAGELDVEYAEYLTNNYLEYRAMAYVVTAQRAAMDAAE